MNALPENTPWPVGRLAGDAGDAGARRQRSLSAAVWSASLIAHAAVLAVIVSRFGAKKIEPPVTAPIAIEVVAPAQPAPVVAPPAPPVQKPPPKPVQQRIAKPTPPKPRAPVAPTAQPAEHATTPTPELTASHTAQPVSAAPPVPAPSPAPPAPEPVVTPPIGNAAYLHNPAPHYPEAAQEEGWEGRVLLRVHVDASGHPASVEVHVSSGHDVLDKAALAAVRRWTFVPAKRGATPIDGWVDVPLDFRLN